MGHQGIETACSFKDNTGSVSGFSAYYSAPHFISLKKRARNTLQVTMRMIECKTSLACCKRLVSNAFILYLLVSISLNIINIVDVQ